MSAQTRGTRAHPLAGARVLVLGLGVTGLSLAAWLWRHGASVRVHDTRAAPPMLDPLRARHPEVRIDNGPLTEGLLSGVDLVAASPGVPLSQAPIRAAMARGVPVVGDVELFARELPEGQKVLAITGSNGKTTVTTLTGMLVRAAGLDAIVAGNIGAPVLDALGQIEARGAWPEAFVLELSSFQLETTSSLDATAAAVLNVSEDHLDRYAGMDEYAAAKARVFAGRGVQVLNRDDARTLAMARAGRRVVTFGRGAPRGADEWGLLEREGAAWLAHGEEALLPARALRLVGEHNAMNVLAALALADALGLTVQPLLPVASAFAGLPHRVQPIAEIDGVAYVDDSKGTNVGATVAALRGIGRRVVLIAGGEGKGQDFSPLAAAVAEHCRAVVVMGRDGALIERALGPARVRIERATTLEEAVARASTLALRGDAVLLSPACASFDMFRDYVHRSEVFAAAVATLQGSSGDD